MIIRTIALFLIAIASTWLVIYIHTPRPKDLIFDFTKINSTTTTFELVDEGRKVDIKNKIDDAIRNSHRLGKLSDAYVSIMNFKVSIINNTIGNSSIGNVSKKEYLGAICLSLLKDGSVATYTFPFASSRVITDHFQLSDPAIDLVSKAISSFSLCPGIDTSFRKEGELVEAKDGVKFSVVFLADIWTWTIVFVFNFLILLGLLPLLRGGYRFVRKGFEYFQ